MTAERNRPAGLGGGASEPGDPRFEMLKQVLATGMPPEEVADLVVQAIKGDRFYVLTHPDMTPAVQARMTAIVEGTNPTLRMSG